MTRKTKSMLTPHLESLMTTRHHKHLLDSVHSRLPPLAALVVMPDNGLLVVTLSERQVTKDPVCRSRGDLAPLQATFPPSLVTPVYTSQLLSRSVTTKVIPSTAHLSPNVVSRL